MGQIRVRHEEADRFRISVRGHEVIVDQPASGDSAPTPTELFVASLAGCAAFYARRFLSRHGVADGELTVNCAFAWAPDHSRVASIDIDVRTRDGVAAELRPALMRVLEHCTVHESLRETPRVEYAIDGVAAGAPPAELAARR